MSGAESETVRRRLVESLHAAPPQIVLAVTGGGFSAITDLLHVPGASATVLEATVPYAESALAGLIGTTPEQAVSTSTAVAMARAARARATVLTPTDDSGPLFGVSCTAALATNRPKRGEHRAHVAIVGATSERAWSLILDKDARTRVEEDRVVADLVLIALGRAFDIDHTLELAVRPADQLEHPTP